MAAGLRAEDVYVKLRQRKPLKRSRQLSDHSVAKLGAETEPSGHKASEEEYARTRK